MEMELAERDMELLLLLSKCGVMRNEQIKKFYGNPKKYHIKRLEKMSKEGYLLRRLGFVSITQKGLQLLGIENRLAQIKSWAKPQRADMVDLVFNMPGWEVKFGTEIKRERGLNRGSLISAVIKKESVEYAVYQLTAENPKPVTLGRVWNEIQGLPVKGNINRVVVFCKIGAGMEALIAKAVKPKVEEVLLLPYPEGVKILRTYHTEYIYNQLSQKLPGVTPLTTRKFADYQWQGNYVSVLLTNDVVKRYYLNEYYSGSYQREQRQVIIVCAESQRDYFTKQFPLAKIVTV